MPLYRMLQKKIFILHGVKRRLPVLACDRDQKNLHIEWRTIVPSLLCDNCFNFLVNLVFHSIFVIAICHLRL